MIYFDHAATTPIDEAVRKVMCKYLAEEFGNPSSIYKIGREAKSAIQEARSQIAELIGAKDREIIFTSGATESNNTAIKGVYFYASQVLGIKPHIVLSSVEHHCVLDTAKYLKKYFNAEVSFLPVDKSGVVKVSELQNLIKDNTVLVSVMYGNNENGAIQPIREIAKEIEEIRKFRKNSENSNPLVFHVDAVQAFQSLGTDVNDLGVDMLSLTAHKFYGPKGVGLLYVRSGVKYLPQQQGGAQERSLRAGTENTPFIVGMAEAMKIAEANRADYVKNVSEITEYLIKRVTTEIPEVELVGPKETDCRLPHIANFLFKKIEGESILINLDMLGIYASSGSACTSGSLEPSHVTKAMGYSDLDAHGSVRFSFGKLNKKEDIDKLMEHLPKIVEKLRGMSPIK